MIITGIRPIYIFTAYNFITDILITKDIAKKPLCV